VYRATRRPMERIVPQKSSLPLRRTNPDPIERTVETTLLETASVRVTGGSAWDTVSTATMTVDLVSVSLLIYMYIVILLSVGGVF